MCSCYLCSEAHNKRSSLICDSSEQALIKHFIDLAMAIGRPHGPSACQPLQILFPSPRLSQYDLSTWPFRLIYGPLRYHCFIYTRIVSLHPPKPQHCTAAHAFASLKVCISGRNARSTSARLLDRVTHEESIVFLRGSKSSWVEKWGGEDDKEKGRSRGLILMLVKYYKPDVVHQALPDSPKQCLSH